MCQFFSLVSDGKGKAYYFDAELRAKVRSGELDSYDPDSHTSIADFFGFKGEKEDSLNKYEYNPITGKFRIDQLNTADDSRKIRVFCRKLDFSTVVPELIVKPITDPWKVKQPRITKKDLRLLAQWASVWASVRASVRDSVRDSVGASVEASVEASVWDSVWASVWASVGASVEASVWASVGGSVGASVGAYFSSFFAPKEWKHIKHEPGDNPFQPAIDLWERGLVPSFDGKVWRLHHKDKILKEITPAELKGYL